MHNVNTGTVVVRRCLHDRCDEAFDVAEVVVVGTVAEHLVDREVEHCLHRFNDGADVAVVLHDDGTARTEDVVRSLCDLVVCCASVVAECVQALVDSVRWVALDQLCQCCQWVVVAVRQELLQHVVDHVDVFGDLVGCLEDHTSRLVVLDDLVVVLLDALAS